jgi:peptidylprolyl isomerase
MKKSFLLFCLAGALAVHAQTTQTPATSAAKPATTHPAVAHHAASATGPVLPPGIPKVDGPVVTAFSLRTQEIKAGTGPLAEPFKIYKVFYWGYRAADGVKFDSSDEHRQPVLGADGKPDMGPDGKPKLGDVQPLTFQQGAGRLIPGFDQGVTGMHVGGKRRIFIPYQLAYGTREMPDQPAQPDQPGHPGHPAHPGIPAKSDLIFDVELVDVSEPTAPGAHPAAQGNPAAGSSQPAAQPAPQPKQ